MNVCWFVVDDLMQATRVELVARARSKTASLARKLADIPGFGWMRPERPADFRDILGIPWVSEEWAAPMEQRYLEVSGLPTAPLCGTSGAVQGACASALALVGARLGLEHDGSRWRSSPHRAGVARKHASRAQGPKARRSAQKSARRCGSGRGRAILVVNGRTELSDRIHDLVGRHVERSPNAPALLAPGRATLTYAALERRILDTAGMLRAIGIAPRDRVAIVLPNGPEMAVAFLSVSAIATAAPINSVSPQSEFEAYFNELQVAWLLTSATTDSPVVQAAKARKVQVVRVTIDTDSLAGTFRFADHAGVASLTTASAAGSDTAIVLTTSGTTSRPKIVALTHANLCESAGNIAAGLSLRPADRCLDVMPLFHVHGLVGGLLASLAAGASVICPPGFEAPRFFGWMDQLEPTWYTAVPTMHQAIVARAGAHLDVIARRPLRFIRSSSAALPEAVRLALEQEFNAPVIEAYGMTEASHQIAHNPLPPGRRKPGSVGLPSGAHVAILDAGATPVPQGQIGEIAIRGASVITAYERGGVANEQSFAHGWLKTGDSGFIDEDG